MPNTFNTLEQNECHSAAEQIFTYAKSKWAEAELLATNGYYSGALAAKVLALEELTKALILLLDSYGFKFRTLTKLKVLRNDHRDRHVVLMVVAFIDAFGDMLMHMLRAFETDSEMQALLTAEKEIMDSEMQRIFVIKYRSTLGPDLLERTEWAGRLSDLRNLSNYTAYHGQLRSPLDLKTEEYEVLQIGLDRSFGVLASTCALLGNPTDLLKAILPRMVENMVPKMNYSAIDDFLDQHLRKKDFFERIIADLKVSIDQVHTIFEERVAS